ncbi:hypothetical protein DVH24_021542 [Malus domestica]|uniref:Uncharacterized protein n=1 Tax=Malus domestica TaxID=3750 RepID=A0A498JWI0_MALDO|nr:hypothetical protein DVH24_021542 [Malus domestica]
MFLHKNFQKTCKIRKNYHWYQMWLKCKFGTRHQQRNQFQMQLNGSSNENTNIQMKTPIVEDVQKDVNKGKQVVIEEKVQMRTLVYNCVTVKVLQLCNHKNKLWTLSFKKRRRSLKTDVESHLKAIVEEPEKKAKKKATKKMTRGATKRSMATKRVVLRSDLTSWFVDGAIDLKLIDASFYIMSENETK